MSLTNHRRFSCLEYCCAALLLVAATASTVIASDTSARGVVIRNSVSASSRDDLLRRLQTISGWQDLQFDKAGFLRVTTNRFRGGSASARDLLLKALAGDNVIVLEASNSRSDVVFCRVHLDQRLQNDTTQPLKHVVMIDFSDFKYVSGDRQARAAFDVGWAVLHELDHAVNDSVDASASNSETDCETNINQMRSELGLPIRASYYFTLLPLKTDLHLVSKYVRLPFDRIEPGSDKRKRYWLIWDAAIVGGLIPNAQTASLQSSLIGVR